MKWQVKQAADQIAALGNKEFSEYIVRWIAWSIQNPAAAAEVALVLIGEKGAGKGTLVWCACVSGDEPGRGDRQASSTGIYKTACCSSRTKLIGAATNVASAGYRE